MEALARELGLSKGSSSRQKSSEEKDLSPVSKPEVSKEKTAKDDVSLKVTEEGISKNGSTDKKTDSELQDDCSLMEDHMTDTQFCPPLPIKEVIRVSPASPDVESSKLATEAPAPSFDASAIPTAAEARAEEARQKRLQVIQQKAKVSQEVLVETESEFRAYHGLDKQHKTTKIESDEDLAALLQEQRRQLAMQPMADAAALVARCPEVFRALAGGEPLEPLVAAGHLKPSSSSDTSDVDHDLIRFYVREWTPTGETTVAGALDKFGADHLIQLPFVEEARSRPLQRIRYVGAFVDAGRSNRLHQDGLRSKQDAGRQTRLLNFMAEHAPEKEWSSFVIESLTVEVTTPEIMPVDALFWLWAGDVRRGRHGAHAGGGNQGHALKAADAAVAPMEATLINCCRLGGVCMNAASYGGLHRLPALASHPETEQLRREVNKIRRQATPLPALNFDTALVAKVRSQYDCAAWSTPGPVSARVVGLNALYASVPSRGLHILQSIPADQVKGQATRFGPFAGPGLAAFRNATTWAYGYDEAREAEDVEHLKMLGASADRWCIGEEHTKERLPIMLSTLRRVAAARRSAGLLQYLVIHSSQVLQIVVNLKGLSDNVAELDIKNKDLWNVRAQDFGSLVGDLFEVEVGAEKVACIAALHGGIIRRNGDAILRADRHPLLRYVALKTRLLEHFAVEGKTAAEVIEATQAAAEKIGLEPALLAARDRVKRRTSAINSLTALTRYANPAADV